MMLTALLLGLAQPLPEIVRLQPPRRERPAAEEADDAPAQAAPRSEEPMPLPRRAAIGEWTLGMARGGIRCTIMLSDHRLENGMATASLGPNCPEPLFAITRWRLDGQTLTLANRSGKAVATLTPSNNPLGRAWSGRLARGEAGVVMAVRQ
jgi:hypothetical protein